MNRYNNALIWKYILSSHLFLVDLTLTVWKLLFIIIITHFIDLTNPIVHATKKNAMVWMTLKNQFLLQGAP